MSEANTFEPTANELTASTRIALPRITACILARNEEHRIEDALRSLQDWTDEILVLDNESEDRTATIARRYADRILSVPHAANFDGARNLAVEHATGDWLFYLDADERVPPRLGAMLRRLVWERGEEFEALIVPFKNYFCGKWMEHTGWWPGYSRPQLLKKGRFCYNERLHSGVSVNGRTLYFPCDDPNLAIDHHSYDDLHHYLEKINRYTDGEAENLLADGAGHGWQAQLAHFVEDWQMSYERGRGDLDGMHGFVLSFMSAFYRFASRAKLWDLRRKRGELPLLEPVPGSVREMLELMARVTQEGARPWLTPGIQAPALTPARLPLLWCAPLHDPSGYADEARNFVLSLIEADEPLAVCPMVWNEEDAGLDLAVREAIDSRTVRWDTPADVFVSQTTPPLNRPSPHARVSVARTMFETDRLQPGWEQILNRMDRVWVPSEFNRQTFVRSGVDPGKIAVIPGAMDPAPFAAEGVEPWPVPGTEPFKFLSVFDWTLHKGWDVLLEAFVREFGADMAVGLVVKTWSSNGYTIEDIQAQADALLRSKLGKGLSEFPNVHLWHERIPTRDMPRLYRAADCFALPTRGEGWGRPLMEAMASGLPTIATAWSGLTEFHSARTGYPLKYALESVTEAGEREIPIYAGHAWAEPDVDDLRRLMRLTVNRPKMAKKKGLAAAKSIAARFSRLVVAVVLQKELEYCRALAAKKAAQENDARYPRGRNAILIQSARGKQEPLLELTRDYHRDYAEAHGMDYLCRFGAQQESRHPCWDRILFIREVLAKGHYEHIFWMDADTIIAAPERDLRDALPEGTWMGMVTHGDPPLRNNGVLYLRNIPTSHDFLDAVWENWPVDDNQDNDCGEDNAAVIAVLERDANAWHGVASLDDSWNSIHTVNGSPIPVVEAWHGCGTAAARLDAMRAAMARLAPQRRWARSEADAQRREAARASEKLPAALPALVRPAANLVPLDPLGDVDFRVSLGRPLRVRWEGDLAVLSSLAHVNRELCRRLLARKDVELTVAEETEWVEPGEGEPNWELHGEATRCAEVLARSGAELSGPPDVTIRHHFPPDWSLPAEGKLVVIQPWEWGHLPAEWVKGATDRADEVWAYSRFVRDVYARSGVPAEKVPVVPLGFDPDVFTPEGKAYPLPTVKGTRFLFVGGAIGRKGADLLLQAYRKAFTRADDVCLIVKDMGAKTFYRGQGFGNEFRRAQEDPEGPQVLYLEDELPDAELASLYRACTCVVLPYRGEGFGLSPLEGMACGLPAIVTAGGPTDDYLDDGMALRVPFRRRYLEHNRVGAWECIGNPWNLEPDPGALADALRWVRDHPDQARERGRAAAVHVRSGWTWERSVQAACLRLEEIISAGKKTGTMSPTQGADADTAVPAAGPAVRCDGLPEENPNLENLIREPQSAEDSGEEADTARHASGSMERAGKPRRRNKKEKTIEITLCMIARDEEARIAACLESICPYVDEMVVVDTGSIDRTREVARACGARVFDLPWPDSFAAARNHSLEMARGKWIFWMDADDVITPECGTGLRELIRCHPEGAAFQVGVHIPPGPGEATSSVVDHVKLFPSRPNLRFEHRIHEQILPALRRAGVPVLPTDLFVSHAHYDRSPEGQAKKRQRDFRLLALDLADHPGHPFVLFNLGMTHLYATREYELAAHYLRRSLDASDPGDSIVRKAYALLTAARIGQENWSAALAANEEGRSHYPDDAELLFQAGQLYQRVNRYDAARQALERLVAGEDGGHYRSVDTGLRTCRGRHELALLFRQMGDSEHCAILLQEITETYPEYAPAQADLRETQRNAGKIDHIF